MLKIGDFSKLSRISIRMLRHYDELGLLKPKSIDQKNGYRYYSEDQLPEIGKIVALKNMGFALNTIIDILKSFNNPKVLEEFLLIKQKEVQDDMEELSIRVKLIETAIDKLKEGEHSMNYEVSLKELPQRYVASVRGILPSYEHEGVLWKKLMEEIGPLNVQDELPCYALAIFHDGEYKEIDVDVEVQKNVKGKYQNTENVEFRVENPIKYASAIYKGSYEKMAELNESVAKWVVDNGYEFAGKNFNIYHVSPYETQNSEEFVTEICYPVKKK